MDENTSVISDEDENEYMPGQPIKKEIATNGGDFDQFDPVNETSPLPSYPRQSKVKLKDQMRRETLSEIIKVSSLEYVFSAVYF